MDFSDLEGEFDAVPAASVPAHGKPRANLQSADAATAYTTAGRATITLASKKTEARYTFTVKQIPDSIDRWFVSLLSGPDNNSDYMYAGLLIASYNGYSFRLTAKSRVTADAPAAKAFNFFVQKVLNQQTMPDALEVWHEGSCGRCGRKLTVPDSIERGIGPECANKMM